MLFGGVYTTELGKIEIIDDSLHVLHVKFIINNETNCDKLQESALTKEAMNQIQEYFSKKRQAFTLPMQPSGTLFQLKVWEQLQNIPYGQTKSYMDIAKAIDTKGVRALGNAVGKNPLLLLIPCHRVVRKNNTFGGYSCGVHIKQNLLKFENRDISLNI